MWENGRTLGVLYRYGVLCWSSGGVEYMQAHSFEGALGSRTAAVQRRTNLCFYSAPFEKEKKLFSLYYRALQKQRNRPLR